MIDANLQAGTHLAGARASDPDDPDGVPCAPLFATETMAELSVRQGRVADAVAIYRHLARAAQAGRAEDASQAGRVARWKARMAELQNAAASTEQATRPGSPAVPPSVAAKPEGASAPASPAARPVSKRCQTALVIRQPVRSGQLIYAEGRDLIVLAPVHAGAQLLADGHIHVYGVLKGRAVAGAKGARDAQVFCLALEAELVGIDTGYVLSEDVPEAAWGGAARIHLTADGVCLISPLAVGRPAPARGLFRRRRPF